MMRRCLMFGLIFLVFWGLSVNSEGQNFPQGEYKYPPPERSYALQGLEALHGPEDFEKLGNFSKSSNIYKLGSKVAHLYLRIGKGWVSTGFLVGPDLLLTNHHCVYRITNKRENIAYESQTFEQYPLDAYDVYMEYYEAGQKGPISSGVKSILKADAALDYALLRLDVPLGETYGWLTLSEWAPGQQSNDWGRRSGKLIKYPWGKEKAVRIIQHPRGREKEVVRKNSGIVDVKPDVLHYVADTEGGSSGSPVFSMSGDAVIALHHIGIPKAYNEGILMKAIIPEIRRWLPESSISSGFVPSERKEFGKLSDFPKNSAVYRLSRKVAYIQLDNGSRSTGFLIGRDLLLTTYGPLQTSQNFEQAGVYMEYYEAGQLGPRSAGVKSVLKTNAALGYALLHLDKPLGDTYGWLGLSRTTPKQGSSVRIIHHPKSRSKEIVGKNSEINRVSNNELHYVADTEPGSAGAPVFPMFRQEVIAIHEGEQSAGGKITKIGTLMRAIVPEIRTWLLEDSTSAN